MPNFIESLGQQAASQATSGLIGAGMGLLLEKHNDKRQLEQQKKLQELQLLGQKQMGIFNREQAMQMWKDTNFKAQLEQMKLAGISPGLIYGMSGAGGSSTNVASGSTGSTSAPVGGGEIMNYTAQGLNLALLKAQKENIESQTAKNQAEAAATSGYKQEEARASISLMGQEIKNKQAQKLLTDADTHLKNIQGQIQGSTIKEQVDEIVWNALKANELLDQASRDTFIKKATQDDIIKTIHTEAIKAILTNTLIRAQTKMTGEQTQNITAERRNINNKISMWAQDNYLNLLNMSNEQRRTEIQNMLATYNVTDKASIDIITQAFDGVLRGGKK